MSGSEARWERAQRWHEALDHLAPAISDVEVVARMGVGSKAVLHQLLLERPAELVALWDELQRAIDPPVGPGAKLAGVAPAIRRRVEALQDLEGPESSGRPRVVGPDRRRLAWSCTEAAGLGERVQAFGGSAAAISHRSACSGLEGPRRRIRA